MSEVAEQIRKMTDLEIEQALANVGVDINCGACMGTFFCGYVAANHLCDTKRNVPSATVEVVALAAKPLTAETITDEQIRALRDTAWSEIDGGHDNVAPVIADCSIALAKFRHYAGIAVRNAARARCAEILNARSEASK